MYDKELLEIAAKLIDDEEYRTWFMCSPKQALTTELGISSQIVESLMTVVPALLMGGTMLALNGGEPDSPGDYGGWDRS